MIEIDTSFISPKLTVFEPRHPSSSQYAYITPDFKIAADLELRLSNGKSKKFKNRALSLEDGVWVRKEYAGWDSKTKKSIYEITPVDEILKDVIGVRRWGIEKIAKIHREVEIGDIVRFTGTRDGGGYRQVRDINYNLENPFHTNFVSDK